MKKSNKWHSCAFAVCPHCEDRSYYYLSKTGEVGVKQGSLVECNDCNQTFELGIRKQWG